MNYILLFIHFFVLSYSIVPKSKYCINCKYFIQANKNFYSINDRCSYFIHPNGTNTINDYYYCNTARKLYSLCGPTGKYYRKKYTNKT